MLYHGGLSGRADDAADGGEMHAEDLGDLLVAVGAGGVGGGDGGVAVRISASDLLQGRHGRALLKEEKGTLLFCRSGWPNGLSHVRLAIADGTIMAGKNDVFSNGCLLCTGLFLKKA